MCCNEKKRRCREGGKLKGASADCTPERIRECHGEGEDHPCAGAGCEHPERLAEEPGRCPPAQIRRCHGGAAGHPRASDSASARTGG
jgi:hypothetical protein